MNETRTQSIASSALEEDCYTIENFLSSQEIESFLEEFSIRLADKYDLKTRASDRTGLKNFLSVIQPESATYKKIREKNYNLLRILKRCVLKFTP